MRDEEQLARLILLLGLPSVTNQGDIGHPRAEPASELQQALEQNDCRLLCFVGRLINSYASYDQSRSESASGGASRRDVKHTLLRLAVRVVFMRYASSATINHVANQPGDQRNQKAELSNNRIFEWESCLLKSLHAAMAINIKKHHHPVQDVEVEMAWSMVGLLKRWSMISPNNLMSESDRIMRDLWIESINILMDCRQGHDHMSSKPPTSQKTCHDDIVSAGNSDESLMVRTINSILDGSDDITTHKYQDWVREFDTAVSSCVHNFLATDCNPIVTTKILLGMIRWSQGKDAISLDMYWIVLQYLDLCVHRALGDTNMQTNGALSVSYQQNVEKLHPYFFTDDSDVSGTRQAIWNESFLAIKSFLFYGLVVICNSPNINSSIGSSTSKNSSYDDQRQLSYLRDEVSLHRGHIYSVFLGLWQLLGPEWFYQPSTMPSNVKHSALENREWWQRSDFTSSKGGTCGCLGQTGPLCTLIRLAAGEFRLSIGRWMTCVIDNANWKGAQKLGSHNSVVPEIESCARIVAQAVQLMTSLADSHDENVLDQFTSSDGQGVLWTTDAILHIRKSLEDALNTSVQYFNDHDLAVEKIINSSDCIIQSEWEKIGRTCCIVMGTIAPELELDQLLSIHEKDQSDFSLFLNALCSAILFSHHVAKKNKPGSKGETIQFEYDEPLSCLLPCIMSIVSSAGCDFDHESICIRESAQRVLVTLCHDANFVNVISQFLHRIDTRCRSHHDKFSHQTSITPLARLAFFIINGILEISSNEQPSSRLQLTTTDMNTLKTSIKCWEKHFM